MSEPQFSEQESLNIIHSMINKARNQFTENGHLYLLWGWVVFACSIGQFILQNVVHYRQYYLVWILMWPTVIYQFFYLRKKGKASNVRTYTDEIIGYVWIVFIVCAILLVALLTPHLSAIDRQATIWLIMYGMPVFLSGCILRYNGLKLGGISCWLLAISTAFTPLKYHTLLLATAVVCGWILPGYGMQQKFKKQNTQLNYL